MVRAKKSDIWSQAKLVDEGVGRNTSKTSSFLVLCGSDLNRPSTGREADFVVADGEVRWHRL